MLKKKKSNTLIQSEASMSPYAVCKLCFQISVGRLMKLHTGHAKDEPGREGGCIPSLCIMIPSGAKRSRTPNADRFCKHLVLT